MSVEHFHNLIESARRGEPSGRLYRIFKKAFLGETPAPHAPLSEAEWERRARAGDLAFREGAAEEVGGDEGGD
jgi:hypothetical protein